MSLKALSLLISALINSFLGIYVLWKNPKRIQNRVFSILIFNLVLWTLSNFVIALSTDPEKINIVGKFAYAIGTLIDPNFIAFSVVFPNKNEKMIKTVLPVVYPLGVLIVALCFTSLIQRGVISHQDSFRPFFGPLYFLFPIFIIGCICFGILHLFSNWKNAQTQFERIQLKVVFMGISISAGIAIIVNVILPSFGFARLVFLGPSLIVIFVSFILYAIIKYRLFDISVLIKKTTVYALLTTFITTIYHLRIFFVAKARRGVIEYPPIIPAFVVALIIAFAFLPLKERLQQMVDKTFFKKRYDYQKILRETAEELTQVLNLSRLLNLILERIVQSMGIKKASIWLLRNNKYEREAQVGFTSTRSLNLMEGSEPLIQWLKRTRDVVIKEELARSRPTSEILQIDRILEKVEADIAIPIFREKEVTGIIFLSNKESGDIFNQEDINLLLTLASQAGVAIENASLYTQVEEAKVYQESILQNLTGGVIAIDKEGMIKLINDKALQFLGLSREEVLQKNYEEVMREPFLRLLRDTLEKGRGYSNWEVYYSVREVSSLPLGLSTAPLRDSEGKISGAIMVMVDLSDIKRLQQELYQAEKLSTVGSLAAGMAHEIKNPLVAIRTFIQLFQEARGDLNEYKEFSKTALEQVERINKIIQDLLSFSQPTEITFSPCKVNLLVDDVVNLVMPKIREKDIKVEKKYDLEMPIVMLDADRIKQVLLNLILNGIEAMGEKGVLTLGTRFERGGDSHTEDYVQIWVRDTGEGIKPEDMSRIFDPFFSRKKGGSGLGLSVVQRIVYDHRGKIDVESEPGKGSCFKIILPARRARSGDLRKEGKLKWRLY